jgi:hypothetical protein
LRSRGQEDYDSGPGQAKSLGDPISTNKPETGGIHLSSLLFGLRITVQDGPGKNESIPKITKAKRARA